MDQKNEADQKLAEEYWLNQNEGQIVEGKPVYDVTWFKWGDWMIVISIYFKVWMLGMKSE